MRPRRPRPSVDLLTPPELREVEARRAAYIRAPHGKRLARLAALRQAKHDALKARV